MRKISRCVPALVLAASPAMGMDLPDSWELVQVARPGHGGLPWQMRFDEDMPALSNRGDWAIGTNQGVLVNGTLLDRDTYNLSRSGFDINDLGRVVWSASVSTGQGGVFSYDIDSGAGGLVTNGPDNHSKHNPTVNNAGLIVYSSSFEGHESICAHDLTTGETRVVLQGNGGSVRLGERFPVNNAGQIAYYDEGHRAGLKRLEPDGTTTMLPTIGSFWTSIDQLWMNDLGQVAAMPDQDMVIRSGDHGAQRLVDLRFGGPGSDLFRGVDIQVPLINDEGWVAFRAELSDRTEAVYMTDGAAFARVAGVGDPILTDSGWGTIESVQSSGISLNEWGDVLMLVDVDLAGGGGLGDVLVVATVPAPGLAALAAPGLALLGMRRRRAR